MDCNLDFFDKAEENFNDKVDRKLMFYNPTVVETNAQDSVDNKQSATELTEEKRVSSV